MVLATVVFSNSCDLQEYDTLQLRENRVDIFAELSTVLPGQRACLLETKDFENHMIDIHQSMQKTKLNKIADKFCAIERKKSNTKTR